MKILMPLCLLLLPYICFSKLYIYVHGFNPIFEDQQRVEKFFESKSLDYQLYTYDYTNDLNIESMKLKDYIEGLNEEEIIIIAHSTGSIVTRHALTKNNAHSSITFISLAGIFGGYKSANLSFITPQLFYKTESFHQIRSLSNYIQKPGNLPKNVTHYKYEKIERNRLYKNKNDDKASIHNQTNSTVDNDKRLLKKRVFIMGHKEILHKAFSKSSFLNKFF